MKKERLNNNSKLKKTSGKGRGMKWHKLLSRFLLWAAAFMNVIGGTLHFCGLKHMLNSYLSNAVMIPSEMYIDYPALFYLDKCFAVILYIMAVYQIFIAILLIKRKRCAVINLNIMTVVMCFAWAIYDLCFTVFVPNEKFIAASLKYSNAFETFLTAVAAAVIIPTVNWFYYKKRGLNIRKKAIEK